MAAALSIALEMSGNSRNFGNNADVHPSYRCILLETGKSAASVLCTCPRGIRKGIFAMRTRVEGCNMQSGWKTLSSLAGCAALAIAFAIGFQGNRVAAQSPAPAAQPAA